MGRLLSPWQARLPRIAVATHDLSMVWLVWYGLHWMRYAVEPTAPALPAWSVETAVVLLVQGLVFWQAGLYRGLWRFASVPDLWNILKASVLGALGVTLGLFLYN